uniref:Uncharacterized protein n=1 Tax=Physcomitrium patens TaxID=3218 RepID=A0A2K1KSZ7_PHYPA|nr:hypothetical protein PHYPA_003881 [Physcomitrium patens]
MWCSEDSINTSLFFLLLPTTFSSLLDLILLCISKCCILCPSLVSISKHGDCRPPSKNYGQAIKDKNSLCILFM